MRTFVTAPHTAINCSMRCQVVCGNRALVQFSLLFVPSLPCQMIIL
jgi:hypothetical protein